MKIALIVPPFITVPPKRYGGTELFVANLAEGLRTQGHWPVVYTVGESRVNCEIRWRQAHGKWPIESALESSLDDLEHSSWACRDAARDCDLIHLNNAPGLNFARFVDLPFVYTLHHPHEEPLSRYYAHFPRVQFVAISRSQARQEGRPGLDAIHHGLRPENYRVGTGKRDYLCFVGRIAPIKGTHTAIAVARQAGLPLKIAGEIQPIYRDYWEQCIRPHVDGKQVEYVGEVDLEAKNQLLGGARALLFPIEWEEPFGLVMIEAMACGTPVLAFARGAAPEVVENGVSGYVCADAAEMARRAQEAPITPARCRKHFEDHFSMACMVERYTGLYERLARKRRLPTRVLPCPEDVALAKATPEAPLQAAS
ncbi:MAG TPA: glycosyltransferase family 4 protein [Terriglobales bacterium]|nr:glycosyltransferase family 4 protein [Terriglobales bacterium]